MKNDQDERDIEVVADLMSFVLQCVQKGDLQPVDLLLRDTDPVTADTFYSAGLLRASAPFRTRLPHWNQFRDAAVTELHDRGVDTAELLYGLT